MAIDSSLVDKAICYATEAHKNVERRGKEFPYVVHPLEAMAIVATMTGDEELLAAAALHDVVEDTDITVDDIRNEFTERVAQLVDSESEDKVAGVPHAESWHERKQTAMDHLSAADHDSKVVAMGDKLSNMRAIARDYYEQGDSFWNLFHVTNPRDHEWHYRGLVAALEELRGTEAFLEFENLVDSVFLDACKDFSITTDEETQEIKVVGYLTGSDAPKLIDHISEGPLWRLDFTSVGHVEFSAVGKLVQAIRSGKRFYIANATDRVCNEIDGSGAGAIIPTIARPMPFDMTHAEKTFEGHCADTYFAQDGDALIKLYHANEPSSRRGAELEKLHAKAALECGVPTPLVGRFVSVEDRVGVLFARLHGKKSFATAIHEHPERIDVLAREFARACKRLHETPCNHTVFPSIVDTFKKNIDALEGYTAEEKQRMIRFVESAPHAGTCLHGEMHIGNTLMEPGDVQWISMEDFAWGHPLFDVGCVMCTCLFTSEQTCADVFDSSKDQMEHVWDVFVEEYFEATTQEEKQRIFNEVAPYAALKGASFTKLTDKSTDEIRYAINTYLLER